MKLAPEEIFRITDDLRGVYMETMTGKALRANLMRLFKVGLDGRITHEPVRFTAGTETHGIILIDGPGSGKTTAMLNAVRTSEALAENPQTGLPRYIHVKVASPATLRSLACQFLEVLGLNKVSERAKVHELWTLVRHRLQVLDITLVVIDEAHDMFRATAPSETDAMFRMLKSLMQGVHPVVLMLGGTERLRDVTTQDAQVNRRFHKIMPPPLDIAANSPKLRELIAFYAGKAGLHVALRDDLAVRLIHGARYRFGRCVDIIIAAVEEALRSGDERLTGAHFELAWAMMEGCPLGENVFAVDDFMTIALEDDDEIGSRLQDAHNRRSRTNGAPKSKRGQGMA